MYVHISIIFCLNILFILQCTRCFNEYIKKYDVVSFKVTENRNRRAAYLGISERETDLEIEFDCFERNFHLFLSEDKLFQNIPIESFTSDNLTENVSNLRAVFYDGYLKDYSVNSSVLGFMLDDVFTGKVTVEKRTYFIEPAIEYFGNAKLNSKKIIVYRDVDIHPLQRNILPHYPENFPQWEVFYISPNTSASTRMENSGLDISNQTDDLFCEIEIVADHTLYNFFKNKTDKLSAVLYLHSKFADYIFSRGDFNMDGNFDHVRIGVRKIYIYEAESDSNYPMLQADGMSNYLNLFSSRRQNSSFCLSIGMTYRNFQSMAVGVAFKAETDYEGGVGGICDQPLPGFSGNGSLYFNTGVINMHYSDDKPLPLAITMLAFTHEIGHAFGSDHDPLQHSICSPGKSGNYLMYPVSSYGSRNAMMFSPCSRKEIWRALVLKGGCLKHREASCGNAIREGDEECDCGPEIFCEFADPCCTPSDVKPPEKGCTIRAKKGFSCSPKESDCCSKNCSVVEDREALCYSDEVQCLYSFCDGKSSVCPKPRRKPELCTPEFSCDNTTCSNATLCSFQGLQDCICKENIFDQCLQCCRRGNSCIPASELGLVNFEGKPFVLLPGTNCSDGKYVCDDSGHCISNSYSMSTSNELYISMIVIPFCISMLLLLAIFLCQKETEPNIVSMNDNPQL